MNQLAAIAYPDFDTADRVRQEVAGAADEGLAHLEDAVIVERTLAGDIKLHQFTHTMRRATSKGAAGGALIGLLFLAPLLGAAIGAASGAIGGKVADDGIDDLFMKELGSRLRPGAAALIVLGSTDARDQIVARVAPFGGVVVQTSLSKAEEQQLRDALGAGIPS
jgi:uncharacterized membrane protein